MKTFALIVGAGRGTRLGAETPKQYIPLNGPCALRRSIDLFLSVSRIAEVGCVIHADDEVRYKTASEGLDATRLRSPVNGGDTRAASVCAGLEAMAPAQPDAVLIHDAARPFMPAQAVNDILDVLEDNEAACVGLPVVDALWDTAEGEAVRSVPREGLWRAQTPQGFRFHSILAAHRAHSAAGADDVAVAREAGIDVRFVPGSELGYKITTADDLERAMRHTAMC